MTSSFGDVDAVGHVNIIVDADGSKVGPETRKTAEEMRETFNKEGEKLKKDNNQLGEDLVKELREGISRGAKRGGFFDEFEDIIEQLQDEAVIEIQVDREKSRRNGEDAGRDTRNGFLNIFRGGGGGGGLGSLLTGPTGAFFNVPGGGALATVLIPLLGTIIAFVAALVEGLAAATSLLYLIPSLLFGIGLQAAALFIIFGGLGEVIGNAFAATNAEELNEALKDVQINAANVIRELIPWRDFIRSIRDDLQGAFFIQIEGDLTRVLENVRVPLEYVLSSIAGSLGRVASSVLDVFAGDRFAQVIMSIGESTAIWLEGFGPALANFLDGVNTFALAIRPFLDWFGDAFNQWVFNLGEDFKELSTSEGFFGFLEDSKDILEDFGTLLGTVFTFLVTFVNQFIQADKELADQTGFSFMDALTEGVKALIEILASPIGLEAMKGFIIILEGMFGAFLVVSTAILLVLAAISKLIDLVEFLIEHSPFTWFMGLLGFNTTPGPRGTTRGGLREEIDQTSESVDNMTSKIKLAKSAVDTFGDAFSFLGTQLHDRLLPALGTAINDVLTFGQQVVDAGLTAGRNFIVNMVNGISQSVESTLAPKLNSVASFISGFFPHSPAQYGPLSGSGDPLYAGQSIVERLGAGMEMGVPQLNNAANSALSNIFGQGSINVNYYGSTPPTQQQAAMMGAGVGRGIIDQMTATRLAVRTI